MITDPRKLRRLATNEIYQLIDTHLKKLPKNSDGTINEFTSDFQDNDVDALRHAYVSGVFTQEYNELAADLFGRLNEYFPGGGTSSPNSENSINMDLWNNSVGRKYGKKSKPRKVLFKNLIKALKNDELIIDPNTDKRKFTGVNKISGDVAEMIIVLSESNKGKNLSFYDFNKKRIMERSEFVTLIKNGEYPTYEIRVIGRNEIPTSKKDRSSTNNLG
jgi:hypothetical protein